MSKPWQQYQDSVADFFRELEFDVEVEWDVIGARGTHAIDVVATKTIFGVKVLWIVECKLWRSAVPKEKVLTLAQISADVGADRAFLLSESGFQSGALRASEHSNVTLTSLDDLRERARSDLETVQLKALERSLRDLQSRMHRDLQATDYAALSQGGKPAPIDHLADLFEILVIAFPRARAGEFPLALGGQQLTDASAFIRKAGDIYAAASFGFAELQTSALEALRAAAHLVEPFAESVGRFLDAGEADLFASDRPPGEALACMKDVAAKADPLRDKLPIGLALKPVQKVMRALIDGPYLLLANSEEDRKHWRAARMVVEQAITELKKAAFKPPSI